MTDRLGRTEEFVEEVAIEAVEESVVLEEVVEEANVLEESVEGSRGEVDRSKEPTENSFGSLGDSAEYTECSKQAGHSMQSCPSFAVKCCR